MGLVLQVITALHTSYSTLSRDYTMEIKILRTKILFSWYPHEPVSECVYQENPSGVFHGITVARQVYTMA